MPHILTERLAKEVNAQAGRHLALVLRDLSGLPEEILAPYESLPPNQRSRRLSLSRKPNRPPYQYTFHESDDFYPTGTKGLGHVIQATRQEGLDAIHAQVFAERQQNEHAWLWVPGESVWIDATIESTPNDVTYDKCLHAFASHAFGDIDVLHTHPAKGTGPDREIAIQSTTYLMDIALPSGTDLRLLSQMQAVCPADAQLSGSIVSHYGATTIALGKPPGRYHDFSISGIYEQRVSGDSLEPTVAIRDALGDLASRSHFDLGGGYALITSFQPLPSP